MKAIALSLVAVAALVGCSENTPVQTVEWYKTHDAERVDMIAKCKNNPGELSASPNCMNATKAANQLVLQKRGYNRHEPINALGDQ